MCSNSYTAGGYESLTAILRFVFAGFCFAETFEFHLKEFHTQNPIVLIE